MSQFFKPKETRISIFQDWNITAPTLKLPKSDFQEKSKPEQIRRAEQLLNDAELLLHNVLSFLNLKTTLSAKINVHQKTAEKLLEEMYQLNSSRSQDPNQEDNILLRMRQILQESYRLLRGGRMLAQTIQGYFQKANLANYNPQVHQLKYGKSSSETETILRTKIDEIKNGCHNLFRSMNFTDKLPVVFTKEESFQYAYATLFELLSHDSMVRIHAHMICQLKDIEDKKQELIATNRSIEAQYLKYELIYDCLQLMKSESQEITRAKQKLADNYSQATLYVPLASDNYPAKSRLAQEQATLKNSMQQGERLSRQIEAHLKVYRTNMNNFTRVSAQTSLYCYAYRQSLFAKALNNFEQYFAEWKNNYNALAYLYDQRTALQTIKQQQGIRQSFTENDRQNLSKIYEQVRGKKIPKEEKLEGYRRSLLTDYERELQRHRIGFSQRQIRRQDVKSILARQNQFFQRVKAVDTRLKISFLRQNKEHIEKLIFQLQQLELHSSNQETLQASLQLFSAALAYARIIASSASYQIQLQEMQDIYRGGRGYRELPHGMTDVVLNYVHDLGILIRSQVEVQNFGGVHMDQFLQAVQEQVRAKKRIKIDEAVENQIYRISESWLSLHHKHYRFMTPQGEELMLDELRRLGVEIGRRIYTCLRGVTDIPDLQVKAIEIDRSFFYSYRVLLSLVELTLEQRNSQRIDKFKIINLQSVLEATFQYLDTKFADMPVNSKPSNIIKLSLLEIFLAKVYKDSDYTNCIKTLRLQAYLQFMGELYPENYQNQAINHNWLHPLLQIHFRLNSVPNRLLNSHNKSITHQLQALLKSIKRYPLTFSTKHDVSGLISCLRITDFAKTLANIIGRGEYSIVEAGQALVALRGFEESLIVVERVCDSYENVILRERKEASFFLQELRKKAERQLQDLGQRQSLQRHFLDSKSSITLQQGISRLLPRQR